MEFKYLHFPLFVHLLILLVVSHHSLILIQCLNIFIFIFCKREHFEISLAFFIEPSTTWETKHLMSTYTCIAMFMIIYLGSNIFQLLPNLPRKRFMACLSQTLLGLRIRGNLTLSITLVHLE